MTLLVRNVEISGRSGLDVWVSEGRIADISPAIRQSGPEFDGQGGALIPGLIDHHIHLLALGAQADSLSLDGVANAEALAERISAAAALRPPGTWLRIVGYHEKIAGPLGRQELDCWAPHHRVRVQHQTGSLWMLNSRALDDLEEGAPVGLEREDAGRPTGRLWRGDAWLRSRLPMQPPPLAPVGRLLASYGITAVTDASVTTDANSARLLADAARAGDLPQRLTLMSGGFLESPEDAAFALGPMKILLDDHALPDFADMTGKIAQARTWGRPVAVHCVTAGELAFTLAALSTAGARPGDRIEHGGVIPPAAIPLIRQLGLTVVTQPGLVRERGDRYLVDVDPEDLPDLYRCASLINGGVLLAASSDAPYASASPWSAIAAATDRRSLNGAILTAEEAVNPQTALNLYLGRTANPGGSPRRLAPGVKADFCLLTTPLSPVLANPAAAEVRATFVDGALVYERA